MNKNPLVVRLTALVLAFLFLATPIASIFAKNESVASPVEGMVSETPAPETPQPETLIEVLPKSEKPSLLAETSPELSSLESGADGKKSKDKEKNKDKDVQDPGNIGIAYGSQQGSSNPQPNANGMTPPVIPQIDENTGSLEYSYPLTVPPGRNGMQPDLKLQYSSQNTTQGSIFGYGFDINIPKIERINKHGVNKLYDYQDFRSSLSGELVHISNNDYGAKIENGSFLIYKLSGGAWIVTDKKGTIYKFGSSDSSKIYDLLDLNKIYIWYLEEIIDTNGNSIKYFYTKDTADNFIYPDKIIYTNNGASAGIFSVEFKKEFRLDSYTSNRAGFPQKINERIKSIEIYISSNLSRKYDLMYAIGDNSKRSMLEKITESGKDQLGVTTTLPSFDLAYTKGDAGLVDAPSVNYPWVTEYNSSGGSYTMPITLSDQSIKIIDINGDGLKDIVKSSVAYGQWGASHPNFWVLKNNGSGWVVDNSWSQPTYSFVDGSGRTVSNYFIFSNATDIGDWNGDGKDDLIYFWVENLGGGQNKQHAVVLLNTGTGWVQNTNIEADIPTYISYNAGKQNLYLYSNNASSRFIDLNGDGLLDYIYAWNIQINGIHYPAFAVLYNDGEDLKWDSTISQPYVKQNSTSGSNPFTLTNDVKSLDINGDGLVDFMSAGNYQINGIDNPSFWALINNGHGWDQDNSIMHPKYNSLDSNGNSRNNYFTTSPGWLSVDVNADNLPDFLMFGKTNNGGTYQKLKTVLVNTGKEWIQDDTLINIGDYTYRDPGGSIRTDYPTSYDSGSMFFDINGDGLLDIAHASFYQQQGIYYAHNWTLINNGKIANTLAKMVLPEGGSYDFLYKMTSAYRDALANLLNINLPLSYNTVEKIIQNDANSGTHTTNYEYTGGHFFYSDAFNRRFAGFEKINKVNPAGEQLIKYYHQGNITNSVKGEFGDNYFKIGKPYRIEITNSSGSLYSKTINKWDDYDLGNGSKFVKLLQTVNSTYDGNTSHKDTAESYAYNDTNGNTTQKIQWGEVLGSNDGSFTDVGVDKFTTDYTYATEASNFKFQISSQNTIDQNANKVKETRYYYDDLVLGSLTKGNLTKQEDWKGGVSYVANQNTYNSYGLLTSSTDPLGSSTQYAYDAYNLYPTAVTNALNQVTQYIYDYSSGQITQKTDANTRVFQYIYDGLDRLIEEKQPDITNPAVLVTKTAYVYTNMPNAVSVKKSSYLDDATIADNYTYFDGLGRKIQEKAETEGGNFSAKDYVYNSLGFLEKESLPYFSWGANKTPATGDATLYTNYTYDPLGRVHDSINSVGATTNYYDDWRIVIIDQNGKTKYLYKDSYGNLVRVDEHNAGNTYNTFYSYNYLGNLTKITDALGNVRNFTYNGLGQRTIAEDLHSLSDSTFGIWFYNYDNAGNVISTTDPKNQTVNYGYDSLHRMISEDYTGVAGIEVSYTYDVCQNGLGKLCAVTSEAVIDNYSYDPLGNINSQSRTLNATNYVTNYTYDRQGNVVTITNPDGSQVKNIYNTAGLLEQVQRKESTDSGFANVVNNFDYSPEGKITIQSNANGVNTVNTYDATKIYRLTNKITTNSGGGHIQDLAYTYDAVGNITQMVDASFGVTAKTAVYTYDALYRLLLATISNVASGQAPYTQTFTYDAIGNILNKTETVGASPAVINTYNYTGNMGNSYANPHAVTSISDGIAITTYTYDNNGNMTADGIKTYAFDYNNRLAQASVLGSAPPPLTPVTTNFYSASGDGSTHKTNSKWNTARIATSGNSANYIATTFNTRTGKNSSNYVIERSFLPFDTTSLPDNAEVTSAKLKVFVQNKFNDDNDGDDWITVVQGFQPSTTSLTTADYDLAGTINNPVEGIDSSERKDITNIVTREYLTFNLNTTGKGWVSLTGATKFALREGHDVLNSAFVGSFGQYNKLIFRALEWSGTASDPVLEITYTVPSPPPPTSTITYAYDSNGQRVKLVNSTKTTYYPTKLYNIDNSNPTLKVTKHLFSGSQNLATIDGTGATAVIYYNATDLLNSSSIMTDSTGTVAETMDYFPFGSIRIDQKTSTFTEQRKYIGEEYDAETGLNYLNARYYNATLARFISQDPMFWEQQNLSDPQSLNSYSYAQNNPITLSDSTGRAVDVVSKPALQFPFGINIGTHVFYHVKPDHPNEINIQGIPQRAKEFTFAGYSSSSNPFTNKLVKGIGYDGHASSDLSFAKGEKSVFNRMELKPLEGQTDTQFINSLGKAYNDVNLEGMNYRFLGNESGLYDGNSNNFAYTLGTNVGIKDQLDKFTPNPSGKLNTLTAGYSDSLPRTSIYREVKNAVVRGVNNIVDSVKSLNKK